MFYCPLMEGEIVRMWWFGG